MRSYSNDGEAARLRLGTPRTRRNGGVGLAAVMVCILATVQAQTASEYQVKAAYLYNFAKYAEWPEQSLPEGTAPFVIGVFSGDDEFIDALKKTVAEKTAGTHPIIVRRVSLPEQMDFCQMIFLRVTAGRKRTQDAITVLASSSILLVGEDDNFLPQGGMINLVLKNGAIRFEINKDALDRARIHLSPTLLAAAIGQRTSSPEPVSAPLTSASGESRRLKFSTPPEYPELAKQMNITGAVQLELTVGRDGTVKDIRIIGGHPMLTDALVKAVKGWQYEPGLRESRVVVRFVFGR
jgi:TonB family protein